MNDMIPVDSNRLSKIEDSSREIDTNDYKVLADTANAIVSNISNCIGNMSNTYRDVSMLAAQTEVEIKRLDCALECYMRKAQNNLQIYRDTVPLLEKNFESMQSRMDRLMDRALDMLCEDVSEESLRRQEAVMNMIEMTNNSINSLVSKLLPSY